jgi:putative hydrolase
MTSLRASGFDLNDAVAAALRDMAAVQSLPAKQRAFAQASAAIRELEGPVSDLIRPDGTLARIPRIGASSAAIILEVVATGRAATVERLIDTLGHRAAIERKRAWRTGFLSRAAAGEVLARAGADLRARYQGDLQMHSLWSDGRQPVREMAAACLARGYAYCAITDHSGGLAIANGLSAERLRAQAAEGARVNAELGGRFHVLRGVEANISPDGDVDVAPADRDALDLVVAAPHSGLRTARAQTDRMLGVVARPGVHILGHPRGRKYDVRPGVTADWPRVFAAAARHGVAIELDGDPSRQDLDCTAAMGALSAGCLFALDSDAHAASELWYADIALAHALLAGIPVDRIVNCWPLDRLRAWLDARRHGRAS